MKVLFSTDQVYLHGGIEKVMAEKANYFASHFKYEVYVLTTEQKNNLPCYKLLPEIKLIDIEVNYEREKSYFHPSNLAKIPSHFKKWKHALKTIEPDVVIVCNYAFDFYWNPFFITKIPKLKEYHSSRHYENIEREKGAFFKKIQFRLLDLVEKKYSKLVLLNPDEVKYYKNTNTSIIPNPIKIDSNKKAQLSSKKAIAAGRIAPVKGFENAILCWKEVVKAEPEWELHIFGQGETDYISGLQYLIDENKLTKHVFINKAVEDLQLEMLNYSLYLMSSKTECFPMVLLESLAIGLPVISFDCPTGPGNIVKNGEDGFLTKDQDVAELANKVIQYIQDPALRFKFSENAKKNINRFSNDNIMSKWKDLFKSLNAL